MDTNLIRHRIARRRRQARWILKRLPRRASVHRYPIIGRFAALVRAPHFWTWNGWPLAAAIYSGMVISFLPLMGAQIIIALGAAILLRANLPISIATQFISNPLTAAPLYAITFATGWMPAEVLFQDSGAALQTTAALTIGGVFWGLITAFGVHIGHLYRTRRHRIDLRNLQTLAQFQS